MNAEVKIDYIDKNDPGYVTEFEPATQSIRLWKVEERNGYI